MKELKWFGRAVTWFQRKQYVPRKRANHPYLALSGAKNGSTKYIYLNTVARELLDDPVAVRFGLAGSLIIIAPSKVHSPMDGTFKVSARTKKCSGGNVGCSELYNFLKERGITRLDLYPSKDHPGVLCGDMSTLIQMAE